MSMYHRVASVVESKMSAARTAHGDSAGTQALIEVLLLHRHLPAGITIALAAGRAPATWWRWKRARRAACAATPTSNPRPCRVRAG